MKDGPLSDYERKRFTELTAAVISDLKAKPMKINADSGHIAIQDAATAHAYRQIAISEIESALTASLVNFNPTGD